MSTAAWNFITTAQARDGVGVVMASEAQYILSNKSFSDHVCKDRGAYSQKGTRHDDETSDDSSRS